MLDCDPRDGLGAGSPSAIGAVTVDLTQSRGGRLKPDLPTVTAAGDGRAWHVNNGTRTQMSKAKPRLNDRVASTGQTQQQFADEFCCVSSRFLPLSCQCSHFLTLQIPPT